VSRTAGEPNRLNLLRGTLDTFILRAVSGRALHGFEISLWLDEKSRGTLDIDDSALYQALHRLEERGYLEGEWGVSEKNRRARYYRITRAGRTHLAKQQSLLMSYAQTITWVLDLAAEQG
jgi:PadR family transcriptional regulator, regulatory protein PadR